MSCSTGWRAAGLGSQPPVVYRALEFLVENGFAHRIERLGAYVGCTHGGAEHAAAFVVCRVCRIVAETALPRSMRGLIAEAAASGFAVEQVVVEAEGLCARLPRGGAHEPGPDRDARGSASRSAATACCAT